MLIAAGYLQMFSDPAQALFEPQHWRARGALEPTGRGRGSAWFVSAPGEQWVLRHYRRGGRLAAQTSLDRYVWTGEERVRAFVEWRLLAALCERGLPVPAPVAARYARSGVSYRCDLITRRIQGVRPLSDVLAAAAAPAALWRGIGALVARFHDAGLDHADLNAHNILVGADGGLSLVDFDRCRLRAPGAWRDANLQRLRRSLRKVTVGLPAERFRAADWQALMAAYRGA